MKQILNLTMKSIKKLAAPLEAASFFSFSSSFSGPEHHAIRPPLS